MSEHTKCAGDFWFDRHICPNPCGGMHTRCVEHGAALDYCPLEDSGNDPGTPSSTSVGPSATDSLKGSQIFVTDDPVNHPEHYRWLPVEAIQITEHFNFCMGNALKYILRADRKGRPVEDLEKAVWYLQREIANRKKDADTP